MNNSTPFDATRQARRITEEAVSWYIEQQEPLTAARRVAFFEWLRASPRHVAEYFAVAQMHGDFKSVASRKTDTVEELLERARGEDAIVAFPGRRATNRRTPEPRRGRTWRKAAGVAAVAASVAMAWLGVDYWRGMHGYVAQSIAADASAVRSVSLADGTLVQLDRNSRIDVHFDGRYRRIEVVRGNALFDVGKDRARPMLVSVGGHVLQDIGTVFGVKRDAGGDTLTVISGRVRVLEAKDASRRDADLAELTGDAVADLTAGQQISFNDAGHGVAQPVQVARATAWLPSEIRVRHETIGNVARRFNAYTSKPLIIDDARIADRRISGIFLANNPEAFAAYLATLPDVRVVEERDRVRVVANHVIETKAAHL
ncbi:FecR family protein [Dyella soli]|uniref:DUF4880 domain-containing protein n=1 Tax=Dyella soli TaxID=522319 RepID=A0A4R0YUM3_9GAMM|nr:FecR domain-containing protein [Dyella soli]TCI08846.1 DUF4880 domain-containing protein [Dyella soli]